MFPLLLTGYLINGDRIINMILAPRKNPNKSIFNESHFAQDGKGLGSFINFLNPCFSINKMPLYLCI